MTVYHQFQTWKTKCGFILDGELESLAEEHKCKTLLRWSVDTGLELYQSWVIDDQDLTLQNMWDKFEEHCKPQANVLWAHYDLLKKLKQAGLSCDQFCTAIQNQLSLCQYPTETHNILERDIFLFDLCYQMFMSKIIADGENLTTAEIWQSLKKSEWSGHCQTHLQQ